MQNVPEYVNTISMIPSNYIPTKTKKLYKTKGSIGILILLPSPPPSPATGKSNYNYKDINCKDVDSMQKPFMIVVKIDFCTSIWKNLCVQMINLPRSNQPRPSFHSECM